MPAQSPLLSVVPAAQNLTADDLRWDNIVEIATRGATAAQASLMALLAFLNSRMVEAPIVNGVISIDLAAYPGAVFYTTVNAAFRFVVTEGIDNASNSFIWQSIGNGSIYTGNYSFARFPAGGTPIQTSALGKVDTFTFIQRVDWFGFISGQNA